MPKAGSILADALTKAVEGQAGADRRLRDPDRRGARRAWARPPRLLRQPATILPSHVEQAARDVEDPLWRMPLWDPYDEMLKSDIADFANAANTPMAGCITAALFLKKFVPDEIAWAHLDTYAWRDAAKPGRPKGGEALGPASCFCALSNAVIPAAEPRQFRPIIPGFSLMSAATFRVLTGLLGELRGTTTEISSYERGFAYRLDEGPHRLCPIGRTRSHQSADGAVDAGLSDTRARTRCAAWLGCSAFRSRSSLAP